MDKTPTSGSVEGDVETESYAYSSQNPETLKHQSLPYTSQSMVNNRGERKNYKRAANRGRKSSGVLAGRNDHLRSFDSTFRVLHSTSAAKKSPSESAHAEVQPATKNSSSDSVHTLVQPAAKRIKRGRPAKRSPKDEFSKIRQRVRYILNRMNYEQSLLEAYASEGWKRQSLEKIRPEKELERAKAEIVRCKLRIREAFENLDYLLSVGKLEESLFDSEGEICSEDISCAICGLQDVTLNNDIILCDGVCDRGFHQNCLNPPLLTEDSNIYFLCLLWYFGYQYHCCSFIYDLHYLVVPVGDEGWLCPACDCKIDCIDVINELQGTDFSISDSWEKFFPEAAAVAHGSKQNDVSDLPSDDSEDNDFDPNIDEEHVPGHEEGSSEEDGDEGSDSDDSNFITSSDNSEQLKNKEKIDDLGLPSDDSEDDDYDPAGPDSDKDIEEKQDESDFTSDSDDFCAEIAKSRGQDEVSSGAKSGDPTNDLEGATFQTNTAFSSLTSRELQMDQDVVLPVSGTRQVQRLDYKKLYDDAYGEAPSDSSDGEEWSGKSTPAKDNEELDEMDTFACKGSRGTGAVHQSNEFTPQSARQSLHPDGFHGLVDGQHAGELTSNGSNSTAQRRQFEPIINKRLNEHFNTDQYPSRAVKESLAQELGLTLHQVNKWFERTRRYTRVAANKNGSHLGNHSTRRHRSSVEARVEVTDPKGTTMGKPYVCKNEGTKQDSPVKQDIDGEQRMHVPPETNQRYTTSGLVGCPKGDSRDNHGKNTSSRYVGRSKGRSAEHEILGLELEDEGSDSDDPNFVTISGNSLKDKEKVDDLGLPSEDSEDDDYDPTGPDSDKDIEKKQSSSDESDYTSDSDDFCSVIAKSCGQDGVPSGTKAGGDPTNDLEGTTHQAHTAISDLLPKDLEMDQDVVLPISGRRQDQCMDYKQLYDEAYGKASSNLRVGEDWSGKSTPEKDNGKQSETGSFACKSSRRTGSVHQLNEFTPQSARQSLHCDTLHDPVNGRHAGELLTPNSSNSTAQRRQYGPIINQRLHEYFKTDQYPNRAVKESLAQELGLTFRQVNKWFESTRHNTRVAANKNGTHIENHSTKGNRSSVVAGTKVTDRNETMVEKINACQTDVANEDMTSGDLNDVINQDSSPLKQDVGGGLRIHATPNSSQRYTTTPGLVGCRKGESTENHGKNAPSRYVGRPKEGYAEEVVLGLQVVDEGTKKAVLQELKKRKIGG